MIPVLAKTLLGGLWPMAPEGLMVSGVATDNRAVKPGYVFVAIKGARVDGHDFAKAALEAGAVAVVAQRPLDDVPVERTVLVGNPLDAMIEMGGNYRRLFKPLILAVTGSVGKTTTKEFCATVLGAFGPTLKTEGNQNNEIGMPNTLFRLEDEIRYAVVEMGMQGLGEIHKLSVAAAPAGAVVTNIGTAHIQHLGSRENILRAKMEICDGLPEAAPLVLDADDELLSGVLPPGHIHAVRVGIHEPKSDVRALDIRTEGAGQHFTIWDAQFGGYEAYIPVLGEHNVRNSLYAYTAATRLGLAPLRVAQALANFKNTGLREHVVDVEGVTLVEDCYNASPDSMKAALETLAQRPAAGRRIAVLGDMKELGDTAPEAHKALGETCLAAGVELLITVGDMAALGGQRAAALGIKTHICANNEEAAQLLLAKAERGDLVLVKASRGMQFEEILEKFKAGRSGGTEGQR